MRVLDKASGVSAGSKFSPTCALDCQRRDVSTRCEPYTRCMLSTCCTGRREAFGRTEKRARHHAGGRGGGVDLTRIVSSDMASRFTDAGCAQGVVRKKEQQAASALALRDLDDKIEKERAALNLVCWGKGVVVVSLSLCVCVWYRGGRE